MSRETIRVKINVETDEDGDDIETQMAVLVINLNGDKVWLPKSKIEVHHDTIEMPVWLAEDKELI